MKVIHVINSLTAIGGAEKSLSNLLNQDNTNLNDIHVISLLDHNKDIISKLIPDGVKHTCVNMKRNGKIKSVKLLIDIIKKSKPDVIQSWMYASNVICSLVNLLFLNKYSIFWGVHHSLDDYHSEKKSTKIFIQMSKILSRFPDKIIFCSKRSKLQHVDLGFKSDKCIFIPNGHFIPELDNKKYKVNSELVVGMAGRFHSVKNWELAINSIVDFSKNNPNCEVKFVGVGKGVSLSNENFKDIVPDNIPVNLKFDFKDICNDMGSFYSTIDLFILTSNSEGFPNVLCEAMSYGVPCISTDVGDCKYIVGDCYSTVPKGDKLKIVEQLNGFFNLSRYEKESMSQKARSVIKGKVDIVKIICEYRLAWQK